jgi:hypothetical protein
MVHLDLFKEFKFTDQEMTSEVLLHALLGALDTAIHSGSEYVQAALKNIK